MTYIDYRQRVEFGEDEYADIDRHCRERGDRLVRLLLGRGRRSTSWSSSIPPCYKVASASLTDDDLLRALRATGRPIILSTGMSTLEQIDHAVAVAGPRRASPRATRPSTYPCPPRSSTCA